MSDIIVTVPRETELRFRGLLFELEGQVKNVAIWDHDSYTRATDLAKLISESIKGAERERKALVEPFNAGVKALNARFKSITDPLETLLADVKSKLLDFKKKEDELARIRAEEARRIAEANMPPAAQEVEPPAAVSAPARGSLGTFSTQKRWRFRVKDVAAVPDSFKVVSEIAVNAAIKSGVRDIPGLEIFQEDVAVIR